MNKYFVKIRMGDGAGEYWRSYNDGITPFKKYAYAYTWDELKDLRVLSDHALHFKNKALVLVPVLKPAYIVALKQGPYAGHYWMTSPLLTGITRKRSEATRYTLKELMEMKFFETWKPSLQAGRLKLISVKQ